MNSSMSDITCILSQIESGVPLAAERLLPLVYDELRKLAAVRLAQEKPGQTLQATDLVHNAYLMLVNGETSRNWYSRDYFFAAAAEAMRRILVEQARRKQTVKRGHGLVRSEVEESHLVAPQTGSSILSLDIALNRLAEADPQAAQLVNLRYFAGLSSQEAAEILGVSPRTADRIWVYARSFLLRELEAE